MKTRLVIFGITGDLGRRKLLPALKHIYAAGLGEELSVIGVSRRSIDIGELLTQALGTNDALREHFSMYELDLADGSAYNGLREYINAGPDEQVLFYLSVPPNASQQIVTFLGETGLTTPNVKIIMEKPFGFDIDSAESIVRHIQQYYDESQILRVDHYLAKEMAQNIVVLRGANAMFRQIWNKKYISSIEITASESLDIEGRVQFYEQTGALRDIMQGHLMQLAALTLLHVPKGFDWAELAHARLAAFHDIQIADPRDVNIGQYDGYRDEVENQSSLTETFISAVLYSKNPQWTGVPIRLTAGKALAQKSTTIIVNLRAYEDAGQTQLVFRVQPDEGVALDFYIKTPGYDYSLSKQTLDFSFESAVDRMPDAYEQVLIDAIRGERGLFATSDEVIRAWEIVSPIQQAHEKGDIQLVSYPKGSRVEDVLDRAKKTS